MGWTWRIETVRGETQFTLDGEKTSPHRPTSLLVADNRGIRFQATIKPNIPSCPVDTNALIA